MASTQALTEDRKKRLNEAIKRTWDFIKEMKALGVPMTDLVDKVQVLENAVQTGKDLAKAADEAQVSLEQHTANLRSLCNTVPNEDERTICEVQVERNWQARNVNFTLSLKNKNSFVSNAIRITLQRYMPEKICQMLESCKNP
ncbi:MAG TPA: hypothetical protein PLN21_14770 [Gemmatales bacterium]|nr:hypothetical protein [Gemmatales bacterium]